MFVIKKTAKRKMDTLKSTNRIHSSPIPLKKDFDNVISLCKRNSARVKKEGSKTTLLLKTIKRLGQNSVDSTLLRSYRVSKKERMQKSKITEKMMKLSRSLELIQLSRPINKLTGLDTENNIDIAKRSVSNIDYKHRRTQHLGMLYSNFRDQH